MRRSAAARATSRPTSVEPVNASLLMRGLSRMYWPDLRAAAGDDVEHAGGDDALGELAPARAPSGDVVDEGLNTVQSPAASTGASFQAAIRNGKFHGTIWPTTPMGSCSTSDIMLPGSRSASPVSASRHAGEVAEVVDRSTPRRWRASRGWACRCRASRCSANCSAFASMTSATLLRMMARSALSVLPHDSNAFHAASTAAIHVFLGRVGDGGQLLAVRRDSTRRCVAAVRRVDPLAADDRADRIAGQDCSWGGLLPCAWHPGGRLLS